MENALQGLTFMNWVLAPSQPPLRLFSQFPTLFQQNRPPGWCPQVAGELGLTPRWVRVHHACSERSPCAPGAQRPWDSPQSHRSGRAWVLCCRSRRRPPCSRSHSPPPPPLQRSGISAPRRSRPPPQSPSRSGPGSGSCCPQTGRGTRALWSALRPSACPRTLEHRENQDAPSAQRTHGHGPRLPFPGQLSLQSPRVPRGRGRASLIIPLYRGP